MKTVAKENLMQIKELLLKLSKDEYNMQPDVLSGASIGQHIRHILEFYLLLVSGSFEGKICYDKRERNTDLETNPKEALATINNLLTGIDLLDENENLFYETDYSARGLHENLIKSSVGRELAYCIEHSIHHQALIKAGLISLGLCERTNEYFGVAHSTIRFRNNSCAQ